MKIKIMNGVFLLFMMVFISSCSKASYPKQKLIHSVKEMCLKEYGLDVEVKYVGKTLGTYVQLASLFDRKKGLNQEASEKVADILLSVTRVSLSTDADVQYYLVIAADNSIPGMEAVFIRYVDDVKKFWYGSISREDFFQRMMIDVRFTPQPLAQRMIVNFFSSLSKGNTKTIMSYLKKLNDDTKTYLSFLKMILELKLKDNLKFNIKTFKVKPIPDEKVLVYTEVEETYDPKPERKIEDYMIDSGFIHKYFFEIGSKNYLPFIEYIIPLNYVDSGGNYHERSMPDKYKAYNDYLEWPDFDFLVEDLTLPEFLSKQMSQRLIRKIRAIELINENKDQPKNKINQFIESLDPNKIENIKLPVKVESINVQYDLTNTIEPSFNLQFLYQNISEWKQLQASTIPSELTDLSLGIVKEVIKKYQFNQFSKIKLIDQVSGEVSVISKTNL